MLGALLCNLPQPITSSGPLRGATTQYRAAGTATSWNKDWAKTYGPNRIKAKAAKKKEIKRAVKVLSEINYIPPHFEDAIDILGQIKGDSMDVLLNKANKRAQNNIDNMLYDYVAAKLRQDEENRLLIMVTYYEFQLWRQRDEDDIAAILMLI
jgi:hypothetical protein